MDYFRACQLTVTFHFRPTDLYHTCYTLSGAAVAQHCETSKPPLILGHPDNELLPTHPVHNVPPKCVIDAYKYFLKNELIESEHTNGQWNGDTAASEEPPLAATASAEVDVVDVDMREQSVDSERSMASQRSTTQSDSMSGVTSGDTSQRSSEERSESID